MMRRCYRVFGPTLDEWHILSDDWETQADYEKCYRKYYVRRISGRGDFAVGATPLTFPDTVLPAKIPEVAPAPTQRLAPHLDKSLSAAQLNAIF